MTITDVNVFKTGSNDKGMIGICSFVLNMDIIIRHVHIFTRYDIDKNTITGIYLLYPKLNREDSAIVYPINKAAGKAIENEVFKKVKPMFPTLFKV